MIRRICILSVGRDIKFLREIISLRNSVGQRAIRIRNRCGCLRYGQRLTILALQSQSIAGGGNILCLLDDGIAAAELAVDHLNVGRKRRFSFAVSSKS